MAEYRKEIDQATFGRIEAYLLGHMDAAAQQAFEQEMNADESLRIEVELQRKLMATAEVGAYLSTQPFAEKAMVRPMINWRKLAVAAAIILIAGSAVWFIIQQSGEKDLYARYYQPDPGLPVVMSSTDAYTFYDGMVSYKEGQFNDAIAKWDSLGREKGFSDTLQYYMGMAHIHLSEYNEAASRLQPVAENENSALRERAAWYLSLVYIKHGDKANAARWLQTIPGNEQASKLLSEPAMQQTP